MPKKLVKHAGSVKIDAGTLNYFNQQTHAARVHPNPKKVLPAFLNDMFEKEVFHGQIALLDVFGYVLFLTRHNV